MLPVSFPPRSLFFGQITLIFTLFRAFPYALEADSLGSHIN